MLNKIVLLFFTTFICQASFEDHYEGLSQSRDIKSLNGAFESESDGSWMDPYYLDSFPPTAEVQRKKEVLYFFSFPKINGLENRRETSQFFQITAISETYNFIGFRVQPAKRPVHQDRYNNLCLYINEVSLGALESIQYYLTLVAAKYNLDKIDRIPIPLIPLPFSIIYDVRGKSEYILQEEEALHSKPQKEKTALRFNHWVDNLEEYQSTIDWKSDFHFCEGIYY